MGNQISDSDRLARAPYDSCLFDTRWLRFYSISSCVHRLSSFTHPLLISFSKLRVPCVIIEREGENIVFSIAEQGGKKMGHVG
ncbi:hypothetical protein K1719_002518 [Acacia pycnantha]|nr:hypothetical protein K1719_002518 [Acacia pycnantha]